MAMATWRSVHVGLEGDGLEIGGLAVWEHEWRSTGEPHLTLPHPSCPKQTHRFDIYAIGDKEHPVHFATGEVSNGVWAFYVLE
jgi:hypothetical protein